MAPDILPAIFGGLSFTIIVTACIVGLVRTGGGRDRRVVGPAIPGDEPTQHERDTAISNLTTLNQWETLRENQRSFGS